MGNVVNLSGGARVRTMEPRPDIARALRNIADRAEAGEIDALVLVATGVDGWVFDVMATPEDNFYAILGALEAMKFDLVERNNYFHSKDPVLSPLDPI
jgi:hypothetical protein